jgi:hypothetical protein
MSAMAGRTVSCVPTSTNITARILPCGDAALSVEVGDVIDVDLNDKVLALCELRSV